MPTRGLYLIHRPLFLISLLLGGVVAGAAGAGYSLAFAALVLGWLSGEVRALTSVMQPAQVQAQIFDLHGQANTKTLGGLRYSLSAFKLLSVFYTIFVLLAGWIIAALYDWQGYNAPWAYLIGHLPTSTSLPVDYLPLALLVFWLGLTGLLCLTMARKWQNYIIYALAQRLNSLINGGTDADEAVKTTVTKLGLALSRTAFLLGFVCFFFLNLGSD